MVKQEPSAVLGKEPSAVLGKEPSAVLGKEPSAVVSKEPSAALSTETSTVVDKEPATSLDKEQVSLSSPVQANNLKTNTYRQDESDNAADSLAESVDRAVQFYMNTMDDQKISGLYDLVLSQIEVPLLTVVMDRTNQNQSRTATILGLNRGTLRKKLKKYHML